VVGYGGNGTLNISNGGASTVDDSTYVAYQPGSSGTIHFNVGVLTTKSLFASPSQLSGTGTINTCGLVGDMDLVFDSNHALNHTFTLNGGNVSVNLNMNTPENCGDLGAGYREHGSLAIRDGTRVNASTGYIGYSSGSVGVATVEGTGSSWNNSLNLFVGHSGDGTLNVTTDASVTCIDIYVGADGNGSLNVLNGGRVSSQNGNIGSGAASTGVAVVDGANSTWTNVGDLRVGRSGGGMLSISNGGTVTVAGSTYAAYESGSQGAIHFDHGTLTTKSLCASPSQVSGTGTINTHGLVSDVDLVFDSTHALKQMFTLNGGNVSVNLDMSDPGSNGDLGVGNRGNGSLLVRDGVRVDSQNGFVGNVLGSTGLATVDGSSSTWTCEDTLYVGYHGGSGTLNINDGATVNSRAGYVGLWPGGTSVVNVNGTNSTWNSSEELFVGYGAGGSLNVARGGSVRSDSAEIGYFGDGVVTVDGVDSKWNCNTVLGYSGSGTLNILRGGTASGNGVIGQTSTATGAATVDGINSTWDCDRLFVGDAGNGTLNISGGGTVNSNFADIGHDSTSTGIVTVDGSGSTWTNSSVLQIGSYGSGTLLIANGGTVNCGNGHIYSGSKGHVLVDGEGSRWLNTGALSINGTMDVAHGGSVSSTEGLVAGNATVKNTGSEWNVSGNLRIGGGVLRIGDGGTVSSDSGSIWGDSVRCVVVVSGQESKWINMGSLNIMIPATTVPGMRPDLRMALQIANGGTVATESIFNGGLLSIDVMNGSSLNVGNGDGTLTNNGSIRIMAGAAPASNASYRPISAGAWNTQTYGVVQALGGTWDSVAREFTASGVREADSGEAISSLDLNSTQRVRIGYDAADLHWTLGASFLAADKSLSLTATAINDGSLSGLLAEGESVFGAWGFAFTSGYAAGDPAYLSFLVGEGYSRDDFKVWHRSGGSWTAFDASDLSYDGQYANFTVTGFSGYAVTGTMVPEPGTLGMALAAGVALVGYGWRRRGHLKSQI
jgi:T5SS/PEP-CTERM-associated repeat protein